MKKTYASDSSITDNSFESIFLAKTSHQKYINKKPITRFFISLIKKGCLRARTEVRKNTEETDSTSPAELTLSIKNSALFNIVMKRLTRIDVTLRL